MFVEKRNYLKTKRWQEKLAEFFKKYLDEAEWNYDFSLEKNDRFDCESSYLSRYIFKKIFESSKVLPLLKKNIEVSSITCEPNLQFIVEKSQCNFHFDIMNNPKVVHSFGKEIKNKNRIDWNNWYDSYHCIGNIAPIPWFDIGESSFNSQLLHLSLDERWDLLLAVYNEIWDMWSYKISFKEYMIISCQQLYYREAYNALIRQIEGENYTIDNVKDDLLLKWIDEYSEKIIGDSDNLELIKFNEDIIISDLIKLRSKIILAILKDEYKQKECKKA